MVRKVVLICLFYLSSNIILGTDLVCSIDKELNTTTISSLEDYRNKAVEICLRCEGGECELKSWPSESFNEGNICKALFCTASKVSRVFKLPEGARPGRSVISFDYFISENGKIKGVEIVKVMGSMNNRQAYKYITSFAKKTYFEPLSIKGKKYRISNLSGEVIATIGKPDELDKYTSPTKGIWTDKD